MIAYEQINLDWSLKIVWAFALVFLYSSETIFALSICHIHHGLLEQLFGKNFVRFRIKARFWNPLSKILTRFMVRRIFQKYMRPSSGTSWSLMTYFCKYPGQSI